MPQIAYIWLMKQEQDTPDDFNPSPLADMMGDMAMNLAWFACILVIAAIVGMIILVHYS